MEKQAREKKLFHFLDWLNSQFICRKKNSGFGLIWNFRHLRWISMNDVTCWVDYEFAISFRYEGKLIINIQNWDRSKKRNRETERVGKRIKALIMRNRKFSTNLIPPFYNKGRKHWHFCWLWIVVDRLRLSFSPPLQIVFIVSPSQITSANICNEDQKI